MAPTDQSVTINVDRLRYGTGEQIRLAATGSDDAKYEWSIRALSGSANEYRLSSALVNRNARAPIIDTSLLGPGVYEVVVRRTDVSDNGSETTTESDVEISVDANPAEALRQSIESGISVKLREVTPTLDQGLWSGMRECLERRSFKNYRAFIDQVLCERNRDDESCGRIDISSAECCYRHGVHAYALLKAATEVWLLCHACCGELERDFTGTDLSGESARLGYEASPEDIRARLNEYLESSATPGTLPYIGQVLDNLGLGTFTSERFPFCPTSIRNLPCMFELLWNYWEEEGGLNLTLAAISLRFQNRRVGVGSRSVLANFELNPLRPLNNFLWGYLQDENHRLSVRRRAYEYEHQYGLRLIGKAVADLKVAERRSTFLEAFHALLNRAAIFYRDSQNLMMKPDAFPLLEALRAVHLLLADGAHNQWGDLPSTARAEMMIQQWLLAQPPMREFLQTRAMVPYDEGWMGPVDAMKKLMGWSPVSIIHFHKLASFGERILLSIRFGQWNAVTILSDQAENWVRYWKPEIQGYIESYRAVTGVDLSATAEAARKVDSTLPAVLMQRRMRAQGGAGE